MNGNKSSESMCVCMCWCSDTQIPFHLTPVTAAATGASRSSLFPRKLHREARVEVDNGRNGSLRHSLVFLCSFPPFFAPLHPTHNLSVPSVFLSPFPARISWCLTFVSIKFPPEMSEENDNALSPLRPFYRTPFSSIRWVSTGVMSVWVKLWLA